MIRPNITQDAPPTDIAVGGVNYTIHTDFRVWIDVLHDMRQLITEPRDEEDILHNATIITITCTKLMDKPIAWESAEQIYGYLNAVSEFAKGYAQPKLNGSGKSSNVQTYSFEQDINAICIAFRKYYGIDISYAGQELHWWLFLEYFRNLCGDDLLILKLMEIRGYDGNDKELKKQAARFALQTEKTAQEEREMEEINKEFFGAV